MVYKKTRRLRWDLHSCMWSQYCLYLYEFPQICWNSSFSSRYLEMRAEFSLATWCFGQSGKIEVRGMRMVVGLSVDWIIETWNVDEGAIKAHSHVLRETRPCKWDLVSPISRIPTVIWKSFRSSIVSSSLDSSLPNPVNSYFTSVGAALYFLSSSPIFFAPLFYTRSSSITTLRRSISSNVSRIFIYRFLLYIPVYRDIYIFFFFFLLLQSESESQSQESERGKIR